ncbi:MAG: Coenzyme F420 hydrogenase/dehydrogenase, beta subunit C-terminal domain [Candidatus Andersenbacteria bacterium]|nr:Coenzyme F420 hydrogenase/dehydrogenase, beta subunit C-terminal domain [Candidatus Andersenbacteria bacterium]MBI3250247.1 Coenzyme F420 hydrogenase/dehydrogenase, beta subunit C-terminal domain [Candidatus Andersenbacteria bacterium]
MDKTWQKIQDNIIKEGLSSHTGLEVGLSRGQLRLKNPPHDLTPQPTVPEEQLNLDPAIWEALPDRGLPYPNLNTFIFGKHPSSWLTGEFKQAYVGYALDDSVRIEAASGGVLTQTLLYLLQTKRITGAVVLRLRKDIPYLVEPIIARSREEILSSAGSIYTESAPLTILEKLRKEEGPLAFVGLPDQVAAIRMLQKLNHSSVRSIKYILGPYTGTVMRFGALNSYLRANNATLGQVTSLSYRAGEWPGYLEIRLRGGKILRAEKFYYNYLIPFFITKRSSRLAVDFTNELTDISVGDAWAPEYEKKRGGYSVILARSTIGKSLLEEMEQHNLVKLTPVTYEKVVSMHSHMIDFKKRGSFIRMQWRRFLGKQNPTFGYEPNHIPLSRYIVEFIISGLFVVGSTRIAHILIEHIPLTIIGPIFNGLRITWKRFSSGQKRAGLKTTTFRLT